MRGDTVFLVACLFAGLVAGTRAADPPDARTETEVLKVQIVNLQDQLARAIADGDSCKAEIGPVRARLNAYAVAEARAKLKADLEKAHPDMTVTDRLELQPKTKGAP